MVYVSACIFIVVSIIHLAGCIAENRILCAVTKPLLMPLLALAASAALIPHLPGAQYTLALTVVALAFGTAGDIFLLSPGEKHFIAGLLCFLAGHLFWIAQYGSAFGSVPLFETAAGTVCIAVLPAAAYFILGKPRGAMGAGTVIYGAVLSALVFTGIAAVHAQKPAAALYLAGTLLFLASDSMLGYSVMKKKFPLSHFLIMATYIAAQTLLTAAVVLPQRQQ
ncbi:MAG TPA: hypothetical protein DCL73_00720 [Treponema sp.]|nr:hypothetical protein [Treponema sp.]